MGADIVRAKRWGSTSCFDLFQDVSSVSLSTQPDHYMVIHVKNEYDYLLMCPKKTEVSVVVGMIDDWMKIFTVLFCFLLQSS